MRRHRVLVIGLATLLLAPERASAQQALVAIPRVGVLTPGESERTPMIDALKEGLHDIGYIEGRNIILDFRLAHGDYSLYPQLVAELVALPVDVIVAEGGALVAKASGQVPIIVPTLAGFSRPGGNVTGFTLMLSELNPKRLELLRTAFPQITAVTALVNPSSPNLKSMFEGVEAAAKSLGLGSVGRVEAASPAALRALRPADLSGASAVFVVGNGMFYNYRRDIVALVNEARLPAIYPERDYIDDGGLMAYGVNVPDNFRRAAGYVDRILKGAKPGDLPIQEPARFDFVVNLKTARELSLTIPQTILARATEVIE